MKDKIDKLIDDKFLYKDRNEWEAITYVKSPNIIQDTSELKNFIHETVVPMICNELSLGAKCFMYINTPDISSQWNIGWERGYNAAIDDLDGKIKALLKQENSLRERNKPLEPDIAEYLEENMSDIM